MSLTVRALTRATLAATLLFGVPCGARATHEADGADKADGAPDYTLHEWGVFPVPRNDAWAMRDLMAEWATFPDFFHGSLPERRQVWRGPVTKPVIWIHTDDAFRLDLTVTFQEGKPLIWWPPAEFPAAGMLRMNAGPAGGPGRPATSHYLQWILGVHQPYRLWDEDSVIPKDQWPTAPDVPRDHWVQSLRTVSSAMLFSNGSFTMKAPEPALFTDAFLYYDGIMRAPATPGVERIDGGLRLHTTQAHALHEVVAVERRGGDLFVTTDPERTIEPGDQVHDVLLERVAAEDVDRTLHRLATDLVNASVQAGLHIDEALALQGVWDEGLFHRDGLTLFYRVPQATYDAWLPLTAHPPPARTVRVGLVVHHHLEPELGERVTRLITALGSGGQHAVRAAEELSTIGGAAFPWLEEALASPDPAVAKAAKELLEALDVQRFVESNTGER